MLSHKYVLIGMLAYLPAHQSQAVTIDWSGDVRAGYYAKERDQRDGGTSDTKEWRLRVRPGLSMQINEQWMAKIRAAGRYTTESTRSNDTHTKFFTSIPTTDGLRLGDATLDELYISYKHSNNKHFKIGRMQTKYELAGVAKKSLDRNDSPNTDITWTDGIYFSFKPASGWKHHFILQYQGKDGPTTVRRSPLDFSDNDSRLTYFVAVENKQASGAFVQRGIDISYLPSSLCSDGTGTCNMRDDYFGLVGRAAMQWPLGEGSNKFLLGMELGYAPNTQLKSTAGTGTSGDADGLAGQLTFNLVDFAPHHSFGLVLGRTGAGWLLSPDFRNNNTHIEGRYVWKIAKNQKIAIRLRQRQDLEMIVGETRKQIDRDLYARFTYKF